MRDHLATLIEDFRAHTNEIAVVEHRGVRRYRTSYGELAKIAGCFAAELERRGIGPGERVVLWGQNSAAWIGIFFGCLLRGVIVVPLDAAGDAGFASRVVADTRPHLMVGDPELLKAVAAGGEQGMPNPVDRLPLPTILNHLPKKPLWTVSPAVGPDLPFQIVFTSGTTAEPRGIVHTHRNVLVTLAPIEAEIEKYRRLERPFHPLRFLHSLPLSHVFGQFMGLWLPGVLAAELHFAEGMDPARVVDLIHRDRISVLVAVPRVLALMRSHLLARFPELTRSSVERAGGRESGPPRAKRSNLLSGVLSILKRWWRFRRVHRALGWKFWAIISGGATLPTDLEAFWNQLGFALIQGYGMTETSALVTLNHPFHVSPGSIGKPLPGREVKITGEGEILVRGDMLAGATWQGGKMQPRESEWVATGDLAQRGDSGELKFVGRKGDVIVTGAGLNIHPADLESALMAQHGIHAVAVVGCEMPTGPEPVAVILTGLGDAELTAAVAAANRGLAEFQQIRRVLRWPEVQFPYTSTGKIIKRRIADWACATLSGNRTPRPGGALAGSSDALLALISEVTGEPAPASADPAGLRLSEDLHLDSLGRVQVQSAMEQRFGIDLDDDALATAVTLGDLRQLINAVADGAQPISSGEPPTPIVKSAAMSPEPAAAIEPTPVAEPVGAHPKPVAHPDRFVYPRWPWSWPIRLVRTVFIEFVMRPLVWLLAAPTVTVDTPDLPPAPVLLIGNHVTAYDAALVLYAMPGRLRRHVVIAMSGEMLADFRAARNQGNWALNLLAPATYWLITALFNVFPLPRMRGFRDSFAHAGDAMDHSYSVLIFPEGTRTHTDAMGPFRTGIGLLAQDAQVPIVPVALEGLAKIRTQRRPWFHSGEIELRVGTPIPLEAQQGTPADLAKELERRMRDLLEQRTR